MTTETIGKWGEIDPRFPFQERRWHNRESEQFVVVEGKTEPWHGEGEPPDLRVHLISEKFESHPSPVKTIIENTKNYDEALQSAYKFMEEHPNGT